MRVLANCMAFLIVGCTLPNPAFETGDGVAEDTLGKDSGTLEGTSVGESGDAEASSSSSAGESTDAETTNPSTTNGESSSSTTDGGSSSSTTDGGSSSSTTDGGSSSSTTDGESSSSTTDMSTSSSDTSSDGINQCMVVPTGNDCLDCVISEQLCCDIAFECIDPDNGCGCLILCQLQNTDCNACGNNLPVQQLKANTVVMCISNLCDNVCL